MKVTAALALAAIPFTVLASAVPGQPAPGFTVADLSGKPVDLADYKGKTVVLEWNNFGCPFVQKHYRSGNMQALQKRYGSEVIWLTVNSTNKGSSEYQTPRVLQATLKGFHALPARYLMDDPGVAGMAYGAKTTPHMFVIDGTGKVVYNGAIDDKPSTDLDDVKGAKNYVAAALDDLKAGRPIAVSSTTPYGCSIKY